MEQTFDISSLISCLYKLKSENRCLDEKLRFLTQKRDHLISANSRLALPLNLNGLENSWDSSNNQQLTSTINNALAINNSANSSTLTNNKLNETPTNLFGFNHQTTLTQPNFSSIHNASIHNASTNVTSTSMTNQTQSKSTSNPPTSTTNLTPNNHASNFFNLTNCVNNNSLSNQNFKTLDLNSNLNASFFDSSGLKQTSTNNSYSSFKNGANQLYQVVNGQFNLTNQNTSSPSKLNTSFNNSLSNTSATANNNLISPQLIQNYLQNQQAFSQLNQQTVQNSSMNSQSKR